MNKKELEVIYKAISKTDIREVEIKNNKGSHLHLVRSLEEINESQIANSTVVGNSSGVSISSPVLSKDSPEEKMDIISPEVGFFNRYNPKTKQQYLKLRDEVKKGMVVGTIKAMHVHHEVIAETNGKVVEFLVEQDQPVIFQQPLIRLEKNP